MSISIGSSSLSRVLTSSFSTSTTCQRLKRNSKPSLSWRLFDGHRRDLKRVINAKGDSSQFVYGTLKAKKEFQTRLIPFATSENHELDNELNLDVSEQENHSFVAEDIPLESNSVLHFARTDGKSGFISFYGRSSRSDRKKEEEVFAPLPSKNGSNLFSFIGPTILVASFIIPSLYLRRIVSSIFEDSLLTDFLILFFTEALFYCGVAAFLLLIDHLQRPFEPISSSKSYRGPSTQLVHRVSSGTALALSLIIPMVTMGLVWPWTGPAASATLAPFLVGIVVQFAFEQYARYLKSPSWPVIPIIFQVYRLHQLNRAAQLVTALSFTVRGAEATSHNLAINSSLATLLNVLQFLGIICIWSLASFLMRFFPSSSAIPQS